MGKGMREFKDAVSGRDEDERPQPLPRLRTRSRWPRPCASATPSPSAHARLRRLPRRLGYGEEATLVEHLDEFAPSRLIVAARRRGVLPSGAHRCDRLVRWLMRPPPDGTHIVTLGVTEPFTTAVKLSFYAAVAAAFPVLVWQAWSFFAPAVAEGRQKVVARFVAFATILFAGGRSRTS